LFELSAQSGDSGHRCQHTLLMFKGLEDTHERIFALPHTHKFLFASYLKIKISRHQPLTQFLYALEGNLPNDQHPVCTHLKISFLFQHKILNDQYFVSKYCILMKKITSKARIPTLADASKPSRATLWPIPFLLQ
jgi:hypothetical protein